MQNQAAVITALVLLVYLVKCQIYTVDIVGLPAGAWTKKAVQEGFQIDAC